MTRGFKNNMKACMLVESTSTRPRDRITYLHFDTVVSNADVYFLFIYFFKQIGKVWIRQKKLKIG